MDSVVISVDLALVRKAAGTRAGTKGSRAPNRDKARPQGTRTRAGFPLTPGRSKFLGELFSPSGDRGVTIETRRYAFPKTELEKLLRP
ncbi:MAG: hypothetical protein ABFS86_02230 [Planctomycetota bacterium]